MPRTVDHDARRAEVAALAAALVAERGIGVSVRDVAAEGGFSTTVVTHYFADKRELLRHAYDSAVRDMAARIAAIDPDADDQLRLHCATLLPLDDGCQRIWRTWLAFFGAAVGDAELAALQRRRVRDHRGVLADLVSAQPEAAGVDADTAARTLLALVQGMATETVFDPEDWTAARQLAQLDAALAHVLGRTNP